MIKKLRAILLHCGMLCILLAVLAMGAFGQGNKKAFVTGEVLISVRAGTPAADVTAIAKNVNATIVRSFGALDFQRSRDTYHLRLAAATTDQGTLDAIVNLKKDPRILYAAPNKYDKPMDAIPNDPRYPQQWHLPLINMPLCWVIEKGQPNVIIAIIDSGFDITHPDLKDRLLAGTNTGTPTTPNDLIDTVPHGTHVAGIAAASTDNGEGVAGVAWQNVKILPIKAVDSTNTFPQSSEIAAMQFADSKGAQIINLSLGSADTSDTPDLTNPRNALILTLAKKGILICISAGNDGPNSPPIQPANMASQHTNIYCVGACGPQKEIAVFSSVRPYTTISAPGGDDPTGADTSRQILSTLPLNLGGPYGYEQGTSMSAPCFAGVLALLVSAGGTPDVIRDAVTTTADARGLVAPSPEFGYGVVDAYQAMLKVAVTVVITSPEGIGGKASQGGVARAPDPVETLRPILKFKVGQITPDNLTVKVDDSAVTINPNTNIINVTRTGTDSNGNIVPLAYEVQLDPIDFGPGQHKLEVTGVNGSRVASDVRFFTIAPHVVPLGRSMISIPFFQAQQRGNGLPVTPEYYFGTNFQLARYLDGVGYKFYSSFGPQDPLSSFSPPDVFPHSDGDSAGKPPVGLAFWADVESNKPILTYGQPVSDKSFVIPLHGLSPGSGAFIAWNMVGDPFNFDVPFNSLLVDTPEGRLTVQSAVDRGYLLPNIYSFDGSTGYTFRTLPDGALKAWQGHWVGVTKAANIALVVPPVRITRAAIATRGTSFGDGWTMRIGASLRNLRDNMTIIGASSRAVDGYDRNDVVKPPQPSKYVQVGIVHDDWANRNGVYAQDIRSNAGAKTWKIAVETDQPDSVVTLNWDSAQTLPRSVKLTIRDETSSQAYDMRTRSGLTFNSGSTAGVRRFVITSSPATGIVTRISNVVIQPTSAGRGSAATQISFSLSSDANYEVKVLSATGQALGTVASRAAPAGDVRLVWNGKDSAGRSVAAGTYIVQIRATASDGESVKVIQPFAVFR